MKIGFIGLGNVGGKLSGSLIRNGYDVTVLDLNPELVAEKVATGAKTVDNAAQLMRDCDAVITCLPSPAASNAVMQEMLPEVCEGKVWMEMSTTDQAEAVRLGSLVIEAGGAAVDCPVSGGCHRADTGNISIFAGCDRATFERILPLLTPIWIDAMQFFSSSMVFAGSFALRGTAVRMTNSASTAAKPPSKTVTLTASDFSAFIVCDLKIGPASRLAENCSRNTGEIPPTFQPETTSGHPLIEWC